jgi:predicted amidophosphoribosyltransferase
LKRHPADVVVPMPIHWLRRALRGTSSPEVMAEAIGAQLQVNLAKGMLRCARSTKKQSLLSPRQRQHNVRGAFCVSPKYPPQGLHVVLIDDIVTTGATASEAAQTLRRAGAARVTVAVVARAAASGAPQTVFSTPPNRRNPRRLHAGRPAASNVAGKPQKAIR